MATILQTIFSDAFSGVKSFFIVIKIPLKFVPKGPVDIISLDNGLVQNRPQAIILTNADQINWSIYVALGGDELSREWRCSWSRSNRRCSNYIWVINNFIAYQGVTYIRDFTVHQVISMFFPSLQYIKGSLFVVINRHVIHSTSQCCQRWSVITGLIPCTVAHHSPGLTQAGWDNMANIWQTGIFKSIFLNENCCMLVKISQKYCVTKSIQLSPYWQGSWPHWGLHFVSIFNHHSRHRGSCYKVDETVLKLSSLSKEFLYRCVVIVILKMDHSVISLYFSDSSHHWFI